MFLIVNLIALWIFIYYYRSFEINSVFLIAMKERAFSLTADLPEFGSWPLSNGLKEKYCVRANEINIRKMLEETSEGLAEQTKYQLEIIFDLDYWGEHFSIRNEPKLIGSFNKLIGSVRIDHATEPGFIFASFYEKPLRTYTRLGRSENRGARYFVTIDKRLNTVGKKLQVIWEDINDSLKIVDSVRQEEIDVTSFPEYIGVLDYLKQHFITLFHALTYPERFGVFKQSGSYEYLRNVAANLATRFTRNYYLACVGRDVEKVSPEEILTATKQLFVYLLTNDYPVEYFRSQENDHPFSMMINAQKNVEYYPDVDIIVALPSGGTQSGLVTQLAYAIHSGFTPDLIFLPVSRHAVERFSGRELSKEETERILDQYREKIHGRRILVTEDNSNSGQTAQYIYETLMEAEAKKVNISFLELDPIRIMQKHSVNNPSLGKAPEFVANYGHPDFLRTATGIVPMMRSLRMDYQLRKYYINKIINSSKVDEYGISNDFR